MFCNENYATIPTLYWSAILQWRCLYCKLNLPDIFASIDSHHRQTNKVKILATVGFSKRGYSIFNVFIAYVMCPQLKTLPEIFFFFFS